MEQINIDTVIVGGGVVGMAIARELALRGIEVVVLETEPMIGSITSARNSGVIHAGLYYPNGSLKSRFCVAGRKMLYRYAEERGIWHEQCGKLVVATSNEQIDALHALKENAKGNGVTDIHSMTSAQANKLEPELACAEALLVHQSGMIDVHGLLQAFDGDATNSGALVQTQSRLARAEITSTGGFVAYVDGPDKTRYAIQCCQLINSAGLDAQNVARSIEGFDKTLIPEQVLGKGNYFSLQGKAPFDRLIYPLPVPGSSGLHYRRDLNGRAVFGPDLEVVEARNYQVSPERLDPFFEAIRLYYPNLRRENLMPDYSGIRPKLGPGMNDFVIQTEVDHKVRGLINLFGIESPGVTSCMAIAHFVAVQLNAG